MNKNTKISLKYGLITLALLALIDFTAMYIFMPSLNFQGRGAYILVAINLVILVISIAMYKETLLTEQGSNKLNKVIGVIYKAVTIICGGFIIVALLLPLIFSPIFNSSKFVSRIELNQKEFNEVIPTLKDINKIPLMDTESAKKLGDRVIGSLSDLVSQYNVSDKYYTICYKGQVVKIAPLEYASFFKYESNKKDGIPGYVLVNPETNEAEFKRVEGGIKYSPSGYLQGNLMRQLRFKYLDKIFGNVTFQIDDDDVPYWTVTCMESNTVVGCLKPSEVIIVNAVSGESEIYNIEDVPEWIDYIYDGDTVTELYNSYGKLKNGFFNSLFSQKECTQTTDDFGYIVKDNDIYVYTGVTSTLSDSSNLGFILVNTRTGEYNYFECSGAEEHSAMSSAEGVVQNYGYTASFPSLVNILNEPTYTMVLKDSSGLVKLYAMVNVKNYTIVATGENLKTTLANYKNQLLNSGNKMEVHNTDNFVSKKITIEEIRTAIVNGNTIYFIKFEDKWYKQSVADNIDLVTLNQNDSIEIEYNKENETEKIIPILKVK